MVVQCKVVQRFFYAFCLNPGMTLNYNSFGKLPGRNQKYHFFLNSFSGIEHKNPYIFFVESRTI